MSEAQVQMNGSRCCYVPFLSSITLDTWLYRITYLQYRHFTYYSRILPFPNINR